MLQRISVSVVPSCLLVVCLGCGPGGNELPMGDVSGKVSYKNQPLKSGTITFVHERGRPYSGEITDGAYKLRAAVGKCRVAIVSREPGGAPVKDKPGMTAPGKSLIPEKYENPDMSGLTCDVQAGPNQKDFELGS